MKAWQGVLMGVAVGLLGATQAVAAVLPDSDFVLDGVLHKTTGLVWKRCVEGQIWTGSACSGNAKLYTWDEARALAADGWTLPSIDQLKTIIDLSRTSPDPLINGNAFPVSPVSMIVWSASADAGNAANGKLINFSYASEISYGKNYRLAVRLVRGPQVGAAIPLVPVQPSLTPDGDFAFDVVVHKTTGLIWKRCAEGQTLTGSNCSGKAKGFTWDQAMVEGTDGWGMPTLEQMMTLVDDTRMGFPSTNPTVFPDMPGVPFFTATTDPDPRLSYAVRAVNFATARSDLNNKTDPSAIRLVRGGKTTSTSVTRDPSSEFSLSDGERVFNYLESLYPQYLGSDGMATAFGAGFEYRYYPETRSYLGTKDGRLYFIGPATGNVLLDLGAVSDWLLVASKAGY